MKRQMALLSNTVRKRSVFWYGRQRFPNEVYHIEAICHIVAMQTYLEEDGRILLVNGHKLNICNGVNHPHCQPSDCHGYGKDQHVVAERDDGKNNRDHQRGQEKRWQGTEKPMDRKQTSHTFDSTAYNSNRHLVTSYKTKQILDAWNITKSLLQWQPWDENTAWNHRCGKNNELISTTQKHNYEINPTCVTHVFLKTPPMELPIRRQNCWEKNTQVICWSVDCVWHCKSRIVGPKKAIHSPKLKNTLQ